MCFGINRFHLICMFLWFLILFFATQMIFTIFSNYTPKWQCGEDGPITSDCKVYNACRAHLTFPINQFNGMKQEMDWICKEEKFSYASMFASIIFFGVLTGSFTISPLGDTIGRKKATIFSLALSMIATILLSYSPPISYLLIAIRFFVGVGIGGQIAVGMTFVMEMILPQQRMALRAFFNWGWARLLLTLICWWTYEWRLAARVCTLVAMPSVLIIAFVFPESPTWLHSKGRLREMEESDRYIARISGVAYVPIKRETVERSKTFCELVHTKGLFKRLLVLWCMFFVASICSYATDFFSNTISGHLYINQILFSVFIIISKKVLIIIDTCFPNFKRRTLHQGSQLVVVIIFITLFVLKTQDYQGVVFLLLNLLGTAFMESCWDANWLCVIESMETPCRATATGSCSLIARVGGMLAPFLGDIAKIYPPFIYAFVVVVGAINLIVSYLFLIETKGVNLDKVHIDEEPTETDEMIPTNMRN